MIDNGWSEVVRIQKEKITALEKRCEELEENNHYQQIVIDDLNRILSDATAENAERHGQK